NLSWTCSREIKSACTAQGFGIGLTGGIIERSCKVPAAAQPVVQHQVYIVRAIVFRRIKLCLIGLAYRRIIPWKFTARYTEGIPHKTTQTSNLFFKEEFCSVCIARSKPE